MLESRLKSLGMHKGILLSTSGFQSGAIQYAKQHGIALIQVYDHSCETVSHSGGPDVEMNENDPLTYIEKQWPTYKAICFNVDVDEPIVLYPTEKVISEIYSNANILLREQYGFEISLYDKESTDHN